MENRRDGTFTHRVRTKPPGVRAARKTSTVALLCFLLLGPSLAAAAVAPDPAVDSRLSKRVTLQAEAIPVSRVLTALSATTGVRLSCSPALGDERLVAFVPGS